MLSRVDETRQKEWFRLETGSGGSATLRLLGEWSIDTLPCIRQRLAAAGQPKVQVIEGSGLSRLDTAGALIISRLAGQGEGAELAGFADGHLTLVQQVRRTAQAEFHPRERQPGALRLILEDAGRAVVHACLDMRQMLSDLGHLLFALYRMLTLRAPLRFTSVVYHMEYTGLRAVPIVALMSFLVGGIIAQQAAYQLSYFGADLLTVDLSGILIMREIGLLLAAIMFAGRSGSAFAAELGSMKMREEIDALRIMGRDPVEVLVVPRVLALVLSLPLLTILANGAALGGALLTSWIYADIEPISFVQRLRDVITVNIFFVGLIKAPVMALAIGLVAYMEGMKTRGSAESLGQQVTASVVKAIFLVIVLDGIFALIFAAFEF